MIYYCKHCKNIIGVWNEQTKNYGINNYCFQIQSNKFSSITFLDCKNCKKFVGIILYYVCVTCFGNDLLMDDIKIKNCLSKYRTIINKYQIYDYDFSCKICKKSDYRTQYWFFKELTFYN